MSIVVHMFFRLVSVVYTFAMLMVGSIVQHISRQLVADDSLVAQGTFGVIEIELVWDNTTKTTRRFVYENIIIRL